jgi:hypothetical protein
MPNDEKSVMSGGEVQTAIGVDVVGENGTLDERVPLDGISSTV